MRPPAFYDGTGHFLLACGLILSLTRCDETDCAELRDGLRPESWERFARRDLISLLCLRSLVPISAEARPHSSASSKQQRALSILVSATEGIACVDKGLERVEFMNQRPASEVLIPFNNSSKASRSAAFGGQSKPEMLVKSLVALLTVPSRSPCPSGCSRARQSNP